MYARKLNSKNQILQNLFYPSKYLIRQSYREYPRCVSSHCTSLPRKLYSQGGFISRYISGLSAPQNVSGDSKALCSRKLYTCLNHCQSRAYSSEGDEKNASDDKHIPVVEGTSFDKEKNSREKVNEGVRSCDAHAKLGELDQKEWLYNEKQTIERKKESPVLTRREKSKNEFLRRIVPWENITVSWETFPYYIHDDTKNVLVECAAAHIKHSKHAKLYGARLTSSNGRILLQSEPGTELYRERLVRALAQDLQVPLLVLDSSVLAPYDFGEDHSSDYESEGEGAESGGECTSESDNDEENDSANEDGWSNGEAKSDGTDPDEVEALANVEALKNNAEALEKFIPMVEHFNKETSSEGYESSSETSHSDAHEKPKQLWKKGDRVKYIGSSGADNSPLSSGRRGEVFEVEGDRVRVIFESDENKEAEGKDVEVSKEAAKPLDLWMDVKEIEQDIDSHVEDCYIAMEALHEVLRSRQPLIVYFPDSSQWLSRAVPKSNRNEFVSKLQKIFDELSGPVVLVCGQNKVESGSKEKGRVTMFLPNFARLAKLPLSLKNLAEGLKPAKRSETNDIFKLFTNVMTIESPKEEELLQTFNKQLEEDRRIIISRSNLNELQKVLEENELSCIDLLQTNTDGVILTKKKAEKVVGWAKNHYLASGMLPSDKGERLHLPRESLEVAISRVKEQDTISKKQAHNLKNLAKDEYETNFVSAVVPPGEIGVKFDDIGALEDVKKALHELVILPMRRPELFARGNLLRPCKGILLFGPPGTGKTLLAKALATEAGANFISITGSTLTSKWFGDAEKLTKALFSFASKLAPVIIFVDEVDSLLGARGGAFEHEATRRMRNEFMAAWDGLRTKDSQRILILGATNRPFDLDDAVIRRLPRRVYVDLPDAENRLKILRIFLAQENLESNFQFDKLANVTEGYSGSDLKNLCIAAAYRPVQELIEEESKGGTCKAASSLRSLNLDDFIQSKAKVGPSVSFDAASMNELRKWNEQYGEGGSRKKSPFGF